MDRRVFLKITGLAAAASALESLPVNALPARAQSAEMRPTTALGSKDASGPDLEISTPGTYQITGRVRLEESLVEISGIGHTQWISWSGGDAEQPAVSFTTFEQFDAPGPIPTIYVRGGSLEALSIAPVGLA